MTIINLENFRKQRQLEQQLVTIPIIKRIYKEDGEIKIEVSGETEVSKDWLNGKNKYL
ncbi:MULTISPECIES: hypothetical protein [Bacillus cereus group]|uniref:hypothetical protein n=1 Tax=Bacillus cereus group TaxID=86661 RepID=UPI0015D49029|nr:MULTISPECIES: hypothetical protein [Bacillus cereus group]